MTMTTAPTIRQLWTDTSADVAQHEARWLCEVAVGLDGHDFDDALEEPVTHRMVAHLDAMLARYRTGEPLAYVLGRWGFRRLDLAVDRRVLIPRADTERVVEVVVELVRGNPAAIADLGTGSGAIGLALADELPLDGTRVVVTDVDHDALDVARANLAGIGRAARNVTVSAGSWFEALEADERFDVVVSNPPYVASGSPLIDPAVADWEPSSALFAGDDGLDAIRHLVDHALDHLVDDGWLVLEIGSDQGEDVRRLLHRSGYCDVAVRQDLAGRDRVAIGRCSVRA